MFKERTRPFQPMAPACPFGCHEAARAPRRANAAFNDAVGSYERMVRPSGERLLKLGGTDAGKALAEVPPPEASLRMETVK